MHNLVSHNELADWKVGKTDDVESDSNYELMSDYFQCLTECDTSDHDAKRFCRHILEQHTKGGRKTQNPTFLRVGFSTCDT